MLHSHQLTPTNADSWIVSSLLQKSIRRGEQETAASAAWTYLHQKGSAIWRRLTLIGVEDIGAADPGAVAQVVTLTCDSALRRKVGKAGDLACAVARLLADSPKDRSADYLLSILRKHPCVRATFAKASRLSLDAKLTRAVDSSLPIIERAAFAWSTLVFHRDRIAKLPDRLLEAFGDLGVDRQLVETAELAARRTREPITVFGPLIAAALKERRARVDASAVPVSVTVDNVPMFALDKHTRLGREAIRRFSEQNEPVKSALRRVAGSSLRSAAYMAAFYADAAPVAKRLVWSGSAELERLGTEADMFGAGVPLEAAQELIAVFRANLDHLNALRAQVFRSARVQSTTDPLFQMQGQGR